MILVPCCSGVRANPSKLTERKQIFLSGNETAFNVREWILQRKDRKSDSTYDRM